MPRVVDREPWATHREALTTREHVTQRFLAGAPVPAPGTVALDVAAGRHLMTFVAGRVDPTRTDAGSPRGLAAVLATIHDQRPAGPPRTYESWAWEAKHVVPDWATEPGVWRAAFDLLRAGPPAYDPTFLHRDLRPPNVLWTAEGVSGVVDWVETSTGPAWLDVAHCATSLAQAGGDAARLAADCTALTGRPRERWWEVMDVVGLLPPPGRTAMVRDPVERLRLERRLADSLSRC